LLSQVADRLNLVAPNFGMAILTGQCKFVLSICDIAPAARLGSKRSCPALETKVGNGPKPPLEPIAEKSASSQFVRGAANGGKISRSHLVLKDARICTFGLVRPSKPADFPADSFRSGGIVDSERFARIPVPQKAMRLEPARRQTIQ